MEFTHSNIYELENVGKTARGATNSLQQELGCAQNKRSELVGIGKHFIF